MKPTEAETDRRRTFEFLVLQGIWFLILLGLGKRIPYDGRVWRGEAIYYFDEHGVQTDGSKAFRRETSFPDLY